MQSKKFILETVKEAMEGKPKIVETIQWNGINWEPIREFTGNPVLMNGTDIAILTKRENKAEMLVAEKDDYITKVADGEFYVSRFTIPEFLKNGIIKVEKIESEVETNAT